MRLDGFLLKQESILVPDEIWSGETVTMAFQARFKASDDVSIVRILSKGEASAVVHELSELFWLVLAKLLDGDLLLLFLDVGVLLLL